MWRFLLLLQFFSVLVTESSSGSSSPVHSVKNSAVVAGFDFAPTPPPQQEKYEAQDEAEAQQEVAHQQNDTHAEKGARDMITLKWLKIIQTQNNE